MILPDFVLSSRASQKLEFSGIDSIENCLDQTHFKSYPYKITYDYNSRGYRDQEWPTTIEELKNCVWCIGDSFTVGIGSPVEHSWTNILQKCSGQRIINVSLDGASNDWISRKAKKLIKTVNPKIIVLHWSYVERRENQEVAPNFNKLWINHYESVQGQDWPPCPDLENFDQLPMFIKHELLTQHDLSWKQNLSDEDLRVGAIKSTHKQDIDNLINHIKDISNLNSQKTKIIHSFIPEFIDKKNKNEFKKILDQLNVDYIPEFSKFDLARDGHHYDVKTANYFVEQILLRL
jgi:hypothetical protein